MLVMNYVLRILIKIKKCFAKNAKNNMPFAKNAKNREIFNNQKYLLSKKSSMFKENNRMF